jgi:hypothetical protein
MASFKMLLLLCLLLSILLPGTQPNHTTEELELSSEAAPITPAPRRSGRVITPSRFYDDDTEAPALRTNTRYAAKARRERDGARARAVRAGPSDVTRLCLPSSHPSDAYLAHFDTCASWLPSASLLYATTGILRFSAWRTELEAVEPLTDERAGAFIDACNQEALLTTERKADLLATYTRRFNASAPLNGCAACGYTKFVFNEADKFKVFDVRRVPNLLLSADHVLRIENTPPEFRDVHSYIINDGNYYGVYHNLCFSLDIERDSVEEAGHGTLPVYAPLCPGCFTAHDKGQGPTRFSISGGCDLGSLFNVNMPSKLTALSRICISLNRLLICSVNLPVAGSGAYILNPRGHFICFLHDGAIQCSTMLPCTEDIKQCFTVTLTGPPDSVRSGSPALEAALGLGGALSVHAPTVLKWLQLLIACHPGYAGCKIDAAAVASLEGLGAELVEEAELIAVTSRDESDGLKVSTDLS